MSLASRLNLNKHDPSELRPVYKCTRCTKVLRDSVYKRCPECRMDQSRYMQRYRYDISHGDIDERIHVKSAGGKKIDDDFEEFLKRVKSNEFLDIYKLVVNLNLQEYLVPIGATLDDKKKLIKVHFIERIFLLLDSSMGCRFKLRSSAVRNNKLYLRYICCDDVNSVRLGLKPVGKVKCESKLSLVLSLFKNELRIEFNHKCHRLIEYNT